MLNVFWDEEQPPRKRFGESGAGRKSKVPEVQEAMFEWFINLRETLNRRLPIKMF